MTAQFRIKVAENYCLITSWNYSKELHLHNEFSFSPKSTRRMVMAMMMMVCCMLRTRKKTTTSLLLSAQQSDGMWMCAGENSSIYNFWFFLNQHFISLNHLYTHLCFEIKTLCNACAPSPQHITNIHYIVVCGVSSSSHHHRQLYLLILHLYKTFIFIVFTLLLPTQHIFFFLGLLLNFAIILCNATTLTMKTTNNYQTCSFTLIFLHFALY